MLRAQLLDRVGVAHSASHPRTSRTGRAIGIVIESVETASAAAMSKLWNTCTSPPSAFARSPAARRILWSRSAGLSRSCRGSTAATRQAASGPVLAVSRATARSRQLRIKLQSRVREDRAFQRAEWKWVSFTTRSAPKSSRLANDAVVQRVVPATVDGDLQTLGCERVARVAPNGPCAAPAGRPALRRWAAAWLPRASARWGALSQMKSSIKQGTERASQAARLDRRVVRGRGVHHDENTLSRMPWAPPTRTR